MSNTWKYVSEARGHLVEVYESLLEMPLSFEDRPRSSYEDEKYNVAMKAFVEWERKRLLKLMQVIEVLKKYDVKLALSDWEGHAISFLEKTPSARAKHKFINEDDRILLLCVVLWYARIAIEWLEVREKEGLLHGGVSYRGMTGQAANYGARLENLDASWTQILPEETWIIDELEEDDPFLGAYQGGSYVVIDIEGF